MVQYRNLAVSGLHLSDRRFRSHAGIHDQPRTGFDDLRHFGHVHLGRRGRSERVSPGYWNGRGWLKEHPQSGCRNKYFANRRRATSGSHAKCQAMVQYGNLAVSGLQLSNSKFRSRAGIHDQPRTGFDDLRYFGHVHLGRRGRRDEYHLDIGTVGVGSKNILSLGVGTNTSRTVAGLPVEAAAKRQAMVQNGHLAVSGLHLSNSRFYNSDSRRSCPGIYSAKFGDVPLDSGDGSK